MVRLQPDWIGELVSVCSADDWRDAQLRLGFADVSPMFARMLHVQQEESDGGYSTAEVRACRRAIERLSVEQPEMFAALSWEFRPWTRRHMTRHDDHERLVLAAGAWLAATVDSLCGE